MSIGMRILEIVLPLKGTVQRGDGKSQKYVNLETDSPGLGISYLPRGEFEKLNNSAKS